MRQLNLDHDINAENVIRAYLSSQFSKIDNSHPMKECIPSAWPERYVIETLVGRASGQFIYASTVIRYIQSTKHRPTDRLRVILGISPTPTHETPYAAIDALYTHILSSIDDPRVMQIFSLLVVPRRTEDGLGTFNCPDMIDRLLFFQSGDTQLILADLLSIVAVEDRYSPIRLYHTSLNDFLLDKSRSGPLFVDLSKAHERLARGYLKIYQAEAGSAVDCRKSFSYFRKNFDIASLSADISNDIENMDFFQIYHYFLAKFTHDMPKYIHDRISSGDAKGLTSMWTARQMWKSRLMEQLLQPFKRNDLPNQDRILDTYVHVLHTTYCPADRVVNESLDTLLNQKRFKDYMFRICDHTNHNSCQRCQKISPLASTISYRVLYAFMLHSPAMALKKWDKAVDLNFRERCAEQAYFCLTFTHSIIDAIVVSHRAVTTKRNASRAEIKKRTQHDCYADCYFEAALDCTIILLPYADHTKSVATVLAKFSDASSWNEDYILRRFCSQFRQLESEIHSYLRRAQYNIESHSDGTS
ncbi:hypothetical protein HYPSUDRAFT_1066508 [Hypholoma sublateritium FD-334 SS-4]|uniref:Uncharacterized protein n=1 Tax=Hypholoma sublateritium (strain FD-334 SS-4) TaxID=945553 RepID=A0A0D2LYI4_HYPSF|nr:hypothetical protein HYPSUDRAFT_1066508 [Hypholoma sublateritium FD-334 SS-4]